MFHQGIPALETEQKDEIGEQMGGCSAKAHDLCEQCGLCPPLFPVSDASGYDVI